MLKIVFSSKFKRDFKRSKKQHRNIAEFEKVLKLLVSGKKLPESYRDHSLTGNYADYRECQIEPDWLLVYKIDNDKIELLLFRLGSHSDLF